MVSLDTPLVSAAASTDKQLVTSCVYRGGAVEADQWSEGCEKSGRTGERRIDATSSTSTKQVAGKNSQRYNNNNNNNNHHHHYHHRRRLYLRRWSNYYASMVRLLSFSLTRRVTQYAGLESAGPKTLGSENVEPEFVEPNFHFPARTFGSSFSGFAPVAFDHTWSSIFRSRIFSQP